MSLFLQKHAVRIACNRERAEKERKDGANASSVTMRSWYIIEVLGNGPVDALCVILEIDFAPEPIPFFDVGQMLPLEVLG
jgi:hypothetical protein